MITTDESLIFVLYAGIYLVFSTGTIEAKEIIFIVVYYVNSHRMSNRLDSATGD